jgi:hypothetical protein
MDVHHVPKDIAQLLLLMHNGFATRALFRVHASLIPIINYPTLFKKFYDILFVLPKPQLYVILNAMRNDLPTYVHHWRNHISSNDLLMVPYLHNGSQSYIAPHNKPNQTKLYMAQRVVLLCGSQDGSV